MPELIGPVVERAAGLSADHYLLSGDLTTTALRSEFDMARVALEPLLRTGRVSAVPGNHDRYTFFASRKRRFEQALMPDAGQDYPFTKDLSPAWRLIGLDSACPRVVSSRGRVGREQLERLAALIASAEDRGLVILCHYPMALPACVPFRPHHALADRADLLRIVSQARGPVVYVHGHVHRPWLWRLPGALSPARLVALNAGAPCMVGTSYEAGQGFWEMDLPDDPAQAVRFSRHVPVLVAELGKPMAYDRLAWWQGPVDLPADAGSLVMGV